MRGVSTPDTDTAADHAVVVGGGPAGLAAAEALACAGLHVHLYDAMPSVGRKFLLAGKGGLNLTHGEAAGLLSRHGTARAVPRWGAGWTGWIAARAARLGAPSWGSRPSSAAPASVFPAEIKAAPLLRAWLHRLRMPRAWCSTCGSAGRAGHPPAGFDSTRPRAASRWRRSAWCWRWVAPAGPGSGPTRRGCLGCARPGQRSRRWCRPTADSRWRRRGVRTCASASRVHRSSRSRCASVPHSIARASSSSPTTASKAAWSMRPARPSATPSPQRAAPP
jgi:hypothetical protein